MTPHAPPIAIDAPAPPSNGHAPVAPREIRLDTLQGDRCCAGCGFNLNSQTIIREPHYGLLMVRCPECGCAAALQEYPTLARMTGRIRFLLAAVWLAIVLAGFGATGGIMFGWTTTTSQSVLATYVSAINGEWSRYQLAQQNAGPQQPQTYWYGNVQQTQAWWDRLPPADFFAKFGGWAALNWIGLIGWIFAALMLIPIGIVWSVAFVRLRGLRLLLVLMLPVLFAASLAAYDAVDSTRLGWYLDFNTLAHRQLGLPITIASLIVGAACLFLGALIGRPIARAFLRLVLPARLLAAFSFLWTMDGKAIPKPA